jgi:hypothetical protein
VTTQTWSSSGPLRPHSSAWLRTTAVTGLASALLMPSAVPASAVTTASHPGLPATNPQAIRAPRIDAAQTAPRPQALLKGLAPGGLENSPDPGGDGRSLLSVPRPEPRSKALATPPQSPPTVRHPIGETRIGLDPTPTVSQTKPRFSGPHNRVVSAGRSPVERAGKSPTAAKEGGKIAGSERATTERIERWAATVQTAQAAKAQKGEARPALVTFAEVSPIPKRGSSYRVQTGDSLWRISTQLWADNAPAHSLDRTWRVLYEWNRDVLGPDSSRLYPGQVLEIPDDVTQTTTADPAAPLSGPLTGKGAR